jgi:predicted nucleic acid-binding protein
MVGTRCGGHPLLRVAATIDVAGLQRLVRGLVRLLRQQIHASTQSGRRTSGSGFTVAPMTRYVIGPDVALHLARDEVAVDPAHQLVSPTLLRSQVLALLYQAVQRGEMTRKDAERTLAYVRRLRIRLLGDRVLQQVAWQVAEKLGWPDTYDAEYVALTQLQADAFITLDDSLAKAAKGLVPVVPITALT